MKKIFSLAVAAVLSIGAYADDVRTLTFRTLSGEETSLSVAEGLTITFVDGQLVARTGDSIFQVALSDMQDMYFSFMPVGIKSISSDEIPVGTLVRVYTTDGRMVQSYEQSNGAQPSLPAGLYMINAGGKTTKTIVK